jgi:hypothetical protein
MTKIQFINHASVKIYGKDCCLLSDPWYQGDAFNKGWNLLIELTDEEIYNLLEDVTHIWVSHEHPDHFSIGFFKKFLPTLIENNTSFLFQETKDKRVLNFVKKSGLNCVELPFLESVEVGDDFSVTCFKDGFYDSALLVSTEGKKILNLNDCSIRSESRALEIKNITGECDVLLTQFSYAAWKGGRNNVEWRLDAAKEKLDTLKLQVDVFNPKYLIPFASYIYFSNKENMYLNEGVNTPHHVVDCLNENETHVAVMKPFDILSDFSAPNNNHESLKFWESRYVENENNPKHLYATIDLQTLDVAFDIYKTRVFNNNSEMMMKLLRVFSPFKVFKPVFIYLEDLDKTVSIDIFKEKLQTVDVDAHLVMSSESLNFLFNNTFGFDTLTVNACFEEGKKGGFSSATRTLAIENLNNMGISFKMKFLFNLNIIFLFLNRLRKVSKKIA